MPASLTRDDVLRIAALAHLELSDAEVELFTEQLAHILDYADRIQQVDTRDVDPTSRALANGLPWRDDVPVPSLDRSAALANAPDADRAAGLFKVPKVL